jgi:hypothetical protein
VFITYNSSKEALEQENKQGRKKKKEINHAKKQKKKF